MKLSITKQIFAVFSKYTVGLFYESRYLRGKWFENSTKGWRWCWKNFFMQKVIGYNRHVPFPVSHRNNIGIVSHIIFDPDDLNIFQNFGCYFQAYDGYITIGHGTWIAPNVGIITQNHDINNLSKHEKAKNVVIGKNCWIGMNSMILPGVTLGDHTIVGAGSVVTKSFPEGNCIIMGNPAGFKREVNSEKLHSKIDKQ